jgi:hypothetical protein
VLKLVGFTLALSACATSSSGWSGATSSAASAPITVTWGYAQEFSGYNMKGVALLQ